MPHALIAFAFLGATGAAILRGITWQRRRSRSAFARALGLGYRTALLARGETFAGTYRGFRIEARFPGGHFLTEIALAPVAPGVVLVPSSLREKLLGHGEGFRTGDPAFDSEVIVHGSAATLLALLDSDAREALAMHAHEFQIEVGDGMFRARVDQLLDTVPRFTAVLDAVVTIASHLVPTGTTAARLRERATKDPIADVRRAAFEALAESMPDAAEARAAALAGLVDPEPTVALAAARMLGADGLDALHALARNEHLPVTVRTEAFEVAKARMSGDTATALAASLLKALRPGVRAHAVAALAALGAREHLPAIRSRVQASGGDAEEDRAIAEALGHLDDDANEPALLVLLAREAPLVRLAAVRALGACGTSAAVEHLHAAARGGRDLAAASEQAIAAIHARLHGAAPGQLAVAEPSGQGELSVAGKESGALALSRERS